MNDNSNSNTYRTTKHITQIRLRSRRWCAAVCILAVYWLRLRGVSAAGVPHSRVVVPMWYECMCCGTGSGARSCTALVHTQDRQRSRARGGGLCGCRAWRADQARARCPRAAQRGRGGRELRAVQRHRWRRTRSRWYRAGEEHKAGSVAMLHQPRPARRRTCGESKQAYV
jgi:hypothetical protein